jgi:cellulose synthase/poly-beta-1,6-N-acetylglucosamine synthase-like glycosyltransferase
VTSLLTAILFGSLALVAYTYAGYPLLLALLARVFSRVPKTPQLPASEAAWPSVSVLIAAYNEEHVIRERIENLLALDYPHDRLEFVIASDGSSDRTVAIVREYETRPAAASATGTGIMPAAAVSASTAAPVRVLDYRERSGKANVLNRAMADIRGEIVVLSDANTFMQPDALRKLVAWFLDPTIGKEIGMVCGRLVLQDATSGQNVDSVYWRYETQLKVWENALGALLGANGAIYAIRKHLYPGLPPDTAVDDFVVPLLMRITHGCRLFFEGDAIAVEETAPDVDAEFRRRSRIGAGGFQSLRVLWPLLLPSQGWTAFSFWSHKVLRWLCPLFLIAALAANLGLAAMGRHGLLLAVQVAFYAIAAAGYLLPAIDSGGAAVKLARLPAMFVAMNLALLAGFWRWMRGRQKAVWQRTSRA